MTLAAALGCSRGRAGEPANLLLVVLDTTRADHLSCYGYVRKTTPEIDELAREGVRFDGAYAQSSLTPVSAASFLTGSWPYQTGVRSLFVVGGETLSAQVPSVFERLRDAGRRTAGFVSAKPMGAHYGLSRGFETYDDDFSATAAAYRIERFADAPQRPADETVDRALAWLQQNGDEPFALMLHLFDAHDPSFVPPREFLAKRLAFPVPAALQRLNTPEQWPEAFSGPARVELYDAELEFMSGQVQRVLDALEQSGASKDTLVCVIADHGEAFGEHGFWTHGTLYQEQLRVPLILQGPGLRRGAVVPDTVRLVDLAPTLLELFGLDAVGFEGHSLLSLLRGPAKEPPTPLEVYSEVHHAPQDRLQRDTEMYSLRLERWKYIHRPSVGRHELYDLSKDPGELVNLYDAAHPMVLTLQMRLAQRGAVDGMAASLEGIPEAELQRLRELGYL